MSLTSLMPIKRASNPPLKLSPAHHPPGRSHSTSPYGRSHILKRRPNKLPNPVVPQFPQRVIRSDGSTFIHWTTSPRSLFRLTRDLVNNPLWNSGSMGGRRGEEALVGGRVGRFNKRFEGMNGGSVDWMESMDIGEGSEEKTQPSKT